MAKVPRAGNVKTRLQPFLSAEQCRTLAEAFLFDTINKTRNVCDELIIAFSPAPARNYFAGLEDENLTLIEQKGANLGEKMLNAVEFAFGVDSDANVLMIGTDSPTFPAEFIERAFEALESNAETVLGKSEDGGFYLVGLKKTLPHLFNNIEWSSPLVYEQTVRNIAKLDINKLNLIPDWYDVDNPKDLLHLRDEILKNERTQKFAAQTYQWLISNSEVFSSKSSSSLI
ncbi:MAG: TIGR04282 family arsenosugar biosynthesis glycosyltransferase [Pyrinomonadaceae bacterium]